MMFIFGLMGKSCVRIELITTSLENTAIKGFGGHTHTYIYIRQQTLMGASRRLPLEIEEMVTQHLKADRN